MRKNGYSKQQPAQARKQKLMTEIAPPPPPPKQRHSAAEKAQASLDVAERKLAKLRTRLDLAKTEARRTEAEIAVVNIERDYFASHPALAKPEVLTGAALSDQARIEALEFQKPRQDPPAPAIPPF